MKTKDDKIIVAIPRKLMGRQTLVWAIAVSVFVAAWICVSILTADKRIDSGLPEKPSVPNAAPNPSPNKTPAPTSSLPQATPTKPPTIPVVSKLTTEDTYRYESIFNAWQALDNAFKSTGSTPTSVQNLLAYANGYLDDLKSPIGAKSSYSGGLYNNVLFLNSDLSSSYYSFSGASSEFSTYAYDVQQSQQAQSDSDKQLYYQDAVQDQQRMNDYVGTAEGELSKARTIFSSIRN